MEKKKGRGPDKNPGTRKKRSDAGKSRGVECTSMRVPNPLIAKIKELIKRFKNEINKKNDQKH